MFEAVIDSFSREEEEKLPFIDLRAPPQVKKNLIAPLFVASSPKPETPSLARARGPFIKDVRTEGGGGGFMPKCRQGGGGAKYQILCGRPLWMVPKANRRPAMRAIPQGHSGLS